LIAFYAKHNPQKDDIAMIADGWGRADSAADDKLNQNLKAKYGEDLSDYTDVPRIAVEFEQFWQEDFAHVSWTLKLGANKHSIKLIHAGETVSPHDLAALLSTIRLSGHNI
jgi:hypothetical protein